jgi:hypothetical protein
LFERFMDALGFAGRGPGFRHLDLVKQANSHRIFSSGRLLRPSG